MKPVSVRFKCFGPYMDEQFVDFEALERNGLFLICGETGAGKTTILDAICYALYGKSSGGLRGGLEVMRCALAGSDDDTLVEFIFDSGGKRYKFTRSLKYKTEKNKKSKNLNDYHNCLRLDGETEIPIVEKEQDRYVTQKAVELIGLTYDQFRQVIILPQGQFERLLVSDSEEKETILVSLFHAQRWHRIADELQRRVAERDKGLKEEHRSIAEKLTQYSCKTLPQLEEKLDEQRAGLEALLLQTQEAEMALEQAKKEKDQALLENQAFEELSRRKKRLSGLLERENHFSREEAVLADADRAETIRPRYQAWQTASSEESRMYDNVQRAEKTLREREKTLEQVRLNQERHEEGRAAVEADAQRCVLLKNAREIYLTLEERKQAAREAEQREMEAGQADARAQREYALRDQQLQQAMAAQNRAMQDYQRVQEQYLLGIGATLARELKSGEKCPVCGSREHPEPARPGDAHVTEAQLDAVLKTMNGAGEQVSEALGKRASAEQKKQAAAQSLSEALRQADIVRTAYREAQAQRLEGIDTEQQRAAQLDKLESRVRSFEETEKKLHGQLTAALGGEEAARGLLETARQEHLQAQAHSLQQQELWNCALAESGLETRDRYLAADMGTEEKQRRKTALHQFRAELENARQAVQEQQTLLEGKIRPDTLLAEQQLSAAEKRHRSCVTAQTLAAKQLEDMTRDCRQLEQRLETYETERLRTDADLIFARRLRGDSGISLQRYVLGVMLTSVTAEANRLLAGVYGGRYRLYRTDEIAGRGRKGGLELEVYDAQTSQRRSVTTLSGGEKFLVALSLAIGLSTVVQAQGGGVRLEAMFVDEGFGSLDREAVSDALEVLNGMRRGCGIVGIISHVEQLSEVIPTRLEITKGRNGSVCTLRG